MDGSIPYLLYLGPIRPNESTRAARIAKLIAANASLNLDGTYRMTEMEEAKELGGQHGAAVTNPAGEPILYVVDVPYQRALKLSGGGKVKDVLGRVTKVFQSLLWALLGFHRWNRARTGPLAKSSRAKWQLRMGAAMVIGLVLAFALAVLALCIALWPEQFPKWMTNEKKGARIVLFGIGTGITLGAAYAFVKGRVSALGRLVQEALHYAEHGQARKEVGAVLARAIDRIDEMTPTDAPPARFHVLGYSFGSLVAIDALCPPEGTTRYDRLSLVRSLATVGCPADFVRLYYSDYFNDRVPLQPDLPWHNLFIAGDVFGSNFLDSAVTDNAVTPNGESVSRPERVLQPTENHPFGKGDLTWWDVVKQMGFKNHGRYWNDDYQTTLMDVLMPLWPPMDGSRPRGKGVPRNP